MKVALTFDAELPAREHYDMEAPHHILETLTEYGVRSTWFMQGRWCRMEPALARVVVQSGHLIGNHSMYHAPMTYLDHSSIWEDVCEAEDEIHKTTGVDPKPWFRAPFGAMDESVSFRLERMGYEHVGWDFHVADWEPSTTVDAIVEGVVAGVARSGPVVLLHTWPRTTAQALPLILDRLAGAEFVSVDEL